MNRRPWGRWLLIGSLLSGAAAVVAWALRRRRPPTPVERGSQLIREGAGRLVDWSRGTVRRLVRERS